MIGRLFRTKFSSLPLRTYQRGSVTYYKPPKIKEPGWRAFLQSYNGRKFIYENRSHLPDEAKSNLDPGVDINEQLVFIIDKSRMSSKN